MHSTQTILLLQVFSHAFDDLPMARALGAELLTRVLDDLRSWNNLVYQYILVTITTSAADFKGDGFAERLISQSASRQFMAHQIVIGVTEGVFLRCGADHVRLAQW